MARTTLLPIIAELRRRVYDYGPESFDEDVHYAGDTMRLKCEFRNLSSVLVTPTSSFAKIIDASQIVVVTSGTTVNVSTGVERYDYNIPAAGPAGVWRAEFRGIIGGVTSAYSVEFPVRITQRIWTDDEMQRILDKNRIFTGAVREKLNRSVDYKRYWSEAQDYEWANLYNTDDSTGTGVTPDTEDLVAGEWTFTTAQDKELYVEGHYFNIYAAAADMLMQLAADPNRAAVWSRGAVSVQGTPPLELATMYRRLAHGGRTVQQVRTYR